MAGDVLARVRAEGLLAPGRPVVAMLSGGRDSVCLLDVAVRIAGAEAVTALHVDFGLRAESADDAAFCARLCARLGVGFELRAPATPPEGNVQAWAREQRYAAARELAGAAEIATGHTATDQAETILYRLASSPSRRALLGMTPRSGSLIRPLLGVTRAETEAWCLAHGLDWRDDAANDSEVFARTRVRAGLVPALRAVHPAAEANIVRAAEVLRAEAEVLDELVDETLAGRDRIALARLRALPPALARLIVVRLAEDAAGALLPRAAARTEEVLALDPEREWTALDLGDGVRAVVERGELRMES